MKKLLEKLASPNSRTLYPRESAKDAQSQCPPLETLPNININNPVDCLCERKPEFLIPRRGQTSLLLHRGETAKDEQQSLHSLLPLGEGGRRPDEGLKETGRLACSTTQAAAKAAFTLAEVLITLAVIGVVAALTLPGLIKNHNERAWATAKDVFEKRLEVAAKQMNTEEKLAGYSSTIDFVNELKKYIKITKVCDSNHLTKCFESKILTADGQEVDASNLRTSSQMAKENWGTETIGVQFADGVGALIAYNPNTDQQPFNNQFSATAASMAILYDVSGYKNPNTLGKDVNQNANVTDLGCRISPDLVGGMCITKILAPVTGYSPMTLTECGNAVSEGIIGINGCNYDPDYWAGAVKACGNINKMPTRTQLHSLAVYLYDNAEISQDRGFSYAKLNRDKAAPFLAIPSSYADNRFYIWTGEEATRVGAYYRGFYNDYTSINYNYGDDANRGANFIAVCLK